MKKNSKKGNIGQDNIGYLIIAPFYLFLFVFILIPILVNIYLSFTDYNMVKLSFVGLGNYKRLLTDTILHKSLTNTFLYTAVTLSLVITVGLVMAMGLVKVSGGVRLYRTAIFMPYIISMASASMIFLWMYDPGNGFFNQVLSMFNIPHMDWIYNAKGALWCIIAMSTWKFMGYNMVIYTSGLMGIPKQLYEAALIDGAGVFGQIRHITLPMLRPVTFFLFVTGFINNFNVFEQVNILTAGGPMNATTTVMHQVYKRAFIEFKMGYAASITMFILVIVIIVTALNFKYGSQGQDLDLS